MYTGRTLINYRWSLGSAITTSRAAIKDPLLPGKTSELAIGEEPRRGANSQVLAAEFENLITGIRANPFQKIFLTNNVPYFSEVEYGTYVKTASQKARTPPGGMTRRGEAALQHQLEGLVNLVA